MKDWLQRRLPDPGSLLKHRALRGVAHLLREPRLWVLNRHSVAGAFALGFFILYLPPFGQPFYAAFGAVKLRVNLPIAFSLVWLSNPLTIPPMFYFAYLVGSLLLLRPILPFEFSFWLDWHNWLGILGPVLLGSLVCATLGALVAYWTVQGLWRWNLVRRLKARRQARYGRALSATSPPSSSRQT
ncbi:hypothetical protein Thiowin_02008 [Thiorhodovibrio winogradskyi]|uniref:DUF2062 domain-containing protein n=1 Tax=Thiorhodovibrio winogradskyi TaxID=77007 RepID=A0ABZ0S9Q2_9GAMM|nr:DUF2062 domain-containing protein [Thiorhodovibrio winogradskyi]